MYATTVTTKGQIVIPAEIRKKYDIKKGIKFLVEEKGNNLLLIPLTAEYFNRIAGVLNTKGKLSKALLKERAKDKKREG